jgi:hypothetical protein
MKSDKRGNGPPHLVSLFRGLYTRIAQKLGVDPSHVSRVARGDRESEAVTAALSREIWKIIELTGNQNGNHCGGTLRVAARKNNATKEAANPILAMVKKEMAQPRAAKSARNYLKLPARRS